MTPWQTLKANFDSLMTDGIRNYAQNEFRETPSGLEIEQLPDSRIDAGYAVRMDGVQKVNREINGIMEIIFQVTIEVAFKINMEQNMNPDTNDLDNSKIDYTTAVSDVSAIIQRRCTVDTYQGILSQLDFRSATGLIQNPKNVNVYKCNISFTVGVQVAL